MTRKLPLLSLILLFLLSLLPACTSPQSAFGEGEGLRITATLFPHYDFARVIGGDRVQVVKLLPSGAESHTFEPSAADIVTLSDSDLFLYTGPEMEPWASTVLESIDQPPEVLDLSASVEPLHAEHDHASPEEHAHPPIDPHIWTSPANAVEMVKAIRDALISLDPEGEAVYRANAEDYLAELTELDSELRALSAASVGKTLVFGGRFAFAHLCETYGFAHIAVYRGCDVEAEPSAADITAVIDHIRANGTTHIFREELVAPQSVLTIAAETDAEVLLLHSCHNVTQDELESGISYLSLMKQNLTNLGTALGVD